MSSFHFFSTERKTYLQQQGHFPRSVLIRKPIFPERCQRNCGKINLKISGYSWMDNICYQWIIIYICQKWIASNHHKHIQLKKYKIKINFWQTRKQCILYPQTKRYLQERNRCLYDWSLSIYGGLFVKIFIE